MSCNCESNTAPGITAIANGNCECSAPANRSSFRVHTPPLPFPTRAKRRASLPHPRSPEELDRRIEQAFSQLLPNRAAPERAPALPQWRFPGEVGDGIEDDLGGIEIGLESAIVGIDSPPGARPVSVARGSSVQCYDMPYSYRPRGTSPHCDTQILMTWRDTLEQGPAATAVECADEEGSLRPRFSGFSCESQGRRLDEAPEPRATIEPPQRPANEERLAAPRQKSVQSPAFGPDILESAGEYTCCPSHFRMPVAAPNPGCRESGHEIPQGEAPSFAPPGSSAARGKAGQLFSAADPPFDDSCYCTCWCLGWSSFFGLFLLGFGFRGDNFRSLFERFFSGFANDTDAAALVNAQIAEGPILRPPHTADLETILSSGTAGPMILPPEAVFGGVFSGATPRASQAAMADFDLEPHLGVDLDPALEDEVRREMSLRQGGVR